MQPTRLFDIMAMQAAERPIPDSLAAKVGDKWQTWSSAQVMATAADVSHGLRALGVKRGDRVALISMNRPEWAFVDLGVLQLGAAVVPVYPTATITDYEFILAHADVTVAFVSTRAIFDKLNAAKAKLPLLREIFSFDPIEGVKHFRELTDSGAKNADRNALEAAKAAVKPDDLASLIYTSGTTGTPKGVMLSHTNLMANVTAVTTRIPLGDIKRALSFLPLSHVFERMVSYLYQYASISIYYAESIDTIARNLKEVSPNVFVTVPRLLEKIYDGIVAKGTALTGIKRRLFNWSMALGLAHDPDKQPGIIAGCELAVARRLVFSKWQEALGGQMQLVIVGGSALQPRLARIFAAAGINTFEGYGLTETSPVIAFNTPDFHRVGTVGKPLPNVTVKIQPEEGYRPGEGEILAKGPSIMAGYYKNPEATAESMTADGFFRTGDIGLIEDGFLRLTDRKKEMFKTSGGKYVAPLALEGKLKESPFVGQIMVLGENRKFPSALIVPEAEPVLKWCRDHGVTCGTMADAASSAKVKELFSDEVRRLNQAFGHWEQVKQFRLVADPWTIESGELTPKLSLKRKVILAKFKPLIDEMYNSSESRD